MTVQHITVSSGFAICATHIHVNSRQVVGVIVVDCSEIRDTLISSTARFAPNQILCKCQIMLEEP